MTPKILTISLLLLASCHRHDKKTHPDVVPQDPDSAPISESQPAESQPAEETPKTTELSINDLPDYVGQTVTLKGKISDIPWQHVMAPPAGTKHDYYFNISERQIVLYTKEEISCGTTLEVSGTVLMVEGAAKRNSKAGEGFKEYHLSVDSWKCLP